MRAPIDLTESPMVLDGGLATELERRGHDVSSSLWSARLLQTEPQAIEQLHYDYFAAGARCAISASYQASYEGFATLGLTRGESDVLLRRSVELARAARDRYLRDRPESRTPLYVAASVGPYGAISHDGAEYRGDYGLTVEQLRAFHEARFGLLADSGADFLACETIPLFDEARALAALLRQRPDAAAWISFTSRDGVNTAHGEPLTDCARFLDGVPNVIAIGVNCVRPDIVGQAIRSLKSGSGKPVIVYPNSGEQWDAGSRCWHGDWDRTGLAALASQWLREGARIIGGCCRTGPEDIAALTAAMR